MKASAVLLLGVVLGACCAAAAASEPATWATAHCECSRERTIVCGADGTSYLNKCWAECSGTTVEHEGPCDKLVADVSACDCSKERALVCGADGHTYLNECWAVCVDTDVIHQGPCTRALENPPCACTKERDLVCGADGHTYLNACWAACSGTSVAHEGACKKVSDDDLSASKGSRCLKHCARGRAHPFCGADGVTYPNECFAECAGTDVTKPGFCEKCPLTPESKKANLACDTDGFTWYNKYWLACAGAELAHERACNKADIIEASAENAASCRAACPRGWANVICGSDDVTYASECLANCAGADFAKLGYCKKCDAPSDFAPVCDAQGFTWVNKGYLECAKAVFAHDGECEATPEAVSGSCDDSCDKSGFARPVCGTNDEGPKTYPSECAAECASAHIVHGGFCKPCPIPRIFAPVCDTMGYTWTNQWELKCAGGEKAKDGPCGNDVDESLLAVAEIEGSVTSSECQKACPRVLAPVCGMNDKSYANECRMECDGVELKHEGRCAIVPPAEEAVSDSCDSCDKSKLANPICGDDDQTYPSVCALKCAGVDVGHRGFCKYCPTPRLYAPVCDTNGYTWVNKWALECAKAEKAHDGPCSNADEALLAAAKLEMASSEPAADEAVASPCDEFCDRRDVARGVCGRNGKTYPNECAAKCAGAEVAHDGFCAGCDRPQIFHPVCDVLGYTWENLFALKCAGTPMAHPGVCAEFDPPLFEGAVTSSECQKACPRVLAPVCGMNDKSYANECRMECDGVELKHQGRCAIVPPTEKAVSDSCDDTCDKHDFANPVCGSDNKTYPGRCAAKCAGVDVARRSTCARCPTPQIYAPVCDTRGYTWVNEWDMKCAGGEKAKDGPCSDFDQALLAAAEIEGAVTSSECQKACPRVLAPVCGMNDKSYANQCRMECDGVELKHEGRCAIAVV